MTDQTPGFAAAITNGKVQLLLGTLLAVAAAAGTALLLQAPATVKPADKAAIEQIVHDYILEHPEIIPQAVEKLQQQRIGKLVDENRAAIEKPFAGAWEGAEKGDVVLVEYFDYACGYCRKTLPDLAKLVGEDKGLKIVYRELPILSAVSGDAAKVSLLAAERNQYMPFHRALYASGQVTRDSIFAAAAKVGIDRKAAEATMTNPFYEEEVQSNLAVAQKLQATGTPTFVVGDQVLSGAVGYAALKEAIAATRAK